MRSSTEKFQITKKGVLHNIDTVKAKLENQEKTCIFLGYVKNNTGGTLCMLNLRTKCMVLICDVIWILKTYIWYVSRKQHTKEDNYILQDENNYYNLAHVKVDPIKNEVNNENLKTEETIKTGL